MQVDSFLKLPRLLYTGVLIAAVIYADNTENWLSFGVVVCIIGSGWLLKVCFPLFYRLSQRSRDEHRNQLDEDDKSVE